MGCVSNEIVHHCITKIVIKVLCHIRQLPLRPVQKILPLVPLVLPSRPGHRPRFGVLPHLRVVLLAHALVVLLKVLAGGRPGFRERRCSAFAAHLTGLLLLVLLLVMVMVLVLVLVVCVCMCVSQRVGTNCTDSTRTMMCSPWS